MSSFDGSPKERIILKPRYGGLLGVALRTVLVMCLWTPPALAMLAAWQLSFMAREIPQVPSLDVLQPDFGARVELLDGTYVSGARATAQVPYEALPPHVLQAVIAAEDEDFFVHQAFSPRAIARAAVENFTRGRTTQGGSTLTQQLAKQFMGSERTYQRKVRELLLARRFEATHDKHTLLRTYIETSFFGHTAYGITQASWLYFDKDPRQLTLDEAATLAGLLPSPNRYSPLLHPERARAQRDRVLARIHAIGGISDSELAELMNKPLGTRTPRAIHYPYIHATALRLLTEHEPLDASWTRGARTVVMTHDPVAQLEARAALLAAVEAYDRRQGWPGPLARHTDERADATPRGDAEALIAAARIEEVDASALVARPLTRDAAPVSLSLETLQWASDSALERHYKRPRKLGNLKDSFAVGDVVLVRRERADAAWYLTRPPSMEGALFSLESVTGRVVASVGGLSPDGDAFHRAEQACRQPGSVFKPILYSAALHSGLTTATMLGDVPRELENEARGGIWTPRNADRDFKGFITLKRALAGSRNVPAALLFDRVGANAVIRMARAMGITSTLDPAPSLALGASCVTPMEMTSAYTPFQRHGLCTSPHLIDHVRDANHVITRLEGDFTAPYLSFTERITRQLAWHAQPPDPRAMSDELAAMMWWLLHQVVRSGTAHALPDEWLVAAKTGTTNQFDVWFEGFDGQLTTGVWIGSDKNTQGFGRGEHGATVALPAFQAFMAPRVRRGEELDWEAIFPEQVVFYPIDEPTGLLARPGEPGMNYPFIEGRQPFELAPTRATYQAEQLDLLTQDF